MDNVIMQSMYADFILCGRLCLSFVIGGFKVGVKH